MIETHFIYFGIATKEKASHIKEAFQLTNSKYKY